jgi:hypothetical protein
MPIPFQSLVKHNIARIPGGQALAGLLGADQPAELSQPTEPASDQVSFEKQPDSPVMDEQTRNRLSLIEQMQERFNEQQMIGVFSILDILTAAPDKIDLVLAQLGGPGASLKSAA